MLARPGMGAVGRKGGNGFRVQAGGRADGPWGTTTVTESKKGKEKGTRSREDNPQNTSLRPSGQISMLGVPHRSIEYSPISSHPSSIY